MIIAELRGKLRSLEHQEDVLTSNVFTTLRLFRPYDLLRPFLATGARDLADKITPEHRAQYFFWESLADGTQPDVLIELKSKSPAGPNLLLLIEVKYLSGLSGNDEVEEDDRSPTEHPDASRNQLARESDALAEHRPEMDAERAVIYVTTHAAEPTQSRPRSCRTSHRRSDGSPGATSRALSRRRCGAFKRTISGAHNSMSSFVLCAGRDSTAFAASHDSSSGRPTLSSRPPPCSIDDAGKDRL